MYREIEKSNKLITFDRNTREICCTVLSITHFPIRKLHGNGLKAILIRDLLPKHWHNHARSMQSFAKQTNYTKVVFQ